MQKCSPSLAGGGLYETGAGGSAPKHVQQFLEKGHLRWDSLGEYLALAVSLEDLGTKSDNPRAKILADALNAAVGRYLNENKAPSRRVGEPDNRASHFYLATFWAQAVAANTEDAELAAEYAPIAEQLVGAEDSILAELKAAVSPNDIGGYYHPDFNKATAAMLPAATFNQILGISLP